jgi:Domain of unknown function DUF302
MALAGVLHPVAWSYKRPLRSFGGSVQDLKVHARHQAAHLREPGRGPPIMLAAPLAALDLPLKILVWENPAGGSFVSYLDPAYLGARHQLTDDLTARIAGINAITDAAVAF